MKKVRVGRFELTLTDRNSIYIQTDERAYEVISVHVDDLPDLLVGFDAIMQEIPEKTPELINELIIDPALHMTRSFCTKTGLRLRMILEIPKAFEHFAIAKYGVYGLENPSYTINITHDVGLKIGRR